MTNKINTNAVQMTAEKRMQFNAKESPTEPSQPKRKKCKRVPCKRKPTKDGKKKDRLGRQDRRMTKDCTGPQD